MSFGRGSTSELLTRGLAAAQSGDPGDREEAVFYLEWVTRSPDAAREDEPAGALGPIEVLLRWAPCSRLPSARRGREGCHEHSRDAPRRDRPA